MTVGLAEILAPVTIPIVGLMARLVAPPTAQERVMLCPALMVVGVAVKLEMLGNGMVTVIVTGALTLP